MKKGETLWEVAQWYGIRLNTLYRKNRMAQGEEPVAGQNISLRKKVRK
jgi:LysM repeat protein